MFVLWDLENGSMPDKRALIVDLDGTIYNWVDFFCPSFRAMVHVLMRLTNLDEDTLTESFRRVYQEHKTLEYSFVVQELDIWEELKWSTEEINERAVKWARNAFRRVRSKHLHLYPNIKQTLQWARDQKLIIIAYTDAPRVQAEMRLKFLRIDRFFNRLHSLQDEEVPKYAPSDVLEKLEAGTYYTSRVASKSDFDQSRSKPNPESLYHVMREFELIEESTYLVGDSIAKDIGVAQEVGVVDIWARYGRNLTNQKNMDTLLRITPWTEEELERSRKAAEFIEPTFVIDDFSEITRIIGSCQPRQLISLL
jgi:phosphoglycolate phosphatase